MEGCNVDILTADAPSSETMLRLLIKEVRERAEVYVAREQLKVALKLYVKGSLLMISFYDKCRPFKDDDLSSLFIRQCDISARLGRKASVIRKFIEHAYRYCADWSGPQRCMKKNLDHFGDTPGESPRQKRFRVHAKLMSKVILYHARMLELDSEEGDQSVGSSVDYVEGESSLHSWRID